MGLRFFTTPALVPQPPARAPAEIGIAVAAVGTILIAAVALVLAVPISIASALFISEYAPRTLFGTVTRSRAC